MSQVLKSDVIRKAEEYDVKFIRLQFTDILGVLKNVAIPIGQLEKALDGEIMFDGSSIHGFTRIEESDMYLKPDYSTFSIFPWRPTKGAVARLICDVYNVDGSPFAGCPRNVLKKVLAEAEDSGYSMKVGPEVEFFLFQIDSEGNPKIQTHDKAGYFDLSPIDLGEDARREICLALEEMGYEVEASHHEVAPGQHEIDFLYSDALDIADKIMTFKLVVKNIAHKHGLYASFMPKPIFGINGSGMHTNQSLFKGDNNIFYDSSTKDGLSKEAYHYLGGLIKHSRSFAAITNPTINSYKRLVPGYEAPVYIAWSARNRSPLIRIPAKRGTATRVELRNPDPSCNPYLALAVMLKAGLDGIKNKMEPPAPIDMNIYNMSMENRMELGIESLPASTIEAVNELKKNEIMKEALGEHIFNKFVRAKEMEWNEYASQVHMWEIKQYLTTL